MKTFVVFFNGKKPIISCQIFSVIIVPISFFCLSCILSKVEKKKSLTSKYKYKDRLEKPYKGDGLENTPDDILMSKQGRSY